MQESTTNDYDLLILGGGISGLAVADLAASKGIKTGIVEASEPGQQTSNNTLRIIHGGFRYLQQLNLPRVLQSLRDQNYVYKRFTPHVAPLPCIMPLSKWGLKSRYPVAIANTLYGTMMRCFSSKLSTPKILSATKLKNLSPALPIDAPHGALTWHDLVMTNPQGITDDLVSSLTNNGAIVHSNTTAQSIRPCPGGYEVLTSSGEMLRTKKLINTLGPWIQSVTKPETLATPTRQWCQGINIVVNKQLHPTHAIGLQSSEGRLFFCVPRGGHTAVGTWYVPHDEPTQATATSKNVPAEETLATFLHAFNRTISRYSSSTSEESSYSLSLRDIISVDSGILPMKHVGSAGPELYGDAILTTHGSYCEVLSTKYTTFYSQAGRIVRSIGAV